MEVTRFLATRPAPDRYGPEALPPLPVSHLNVAGAWPCAVGAPRPLPFFESYADCGFPSPADDYATRALDLNDLLVTNEAATFFVRASGTSMLGDGIDEGDILIVDRAVEARSGHIVLARVDGGFTVKRLVQSGRRVALVPSNEAHAVLTIHEGRDFEVWGVVRHCIKSFKA